MHDLESESVIHVAGADAASFLNAQLTRQVDTLGEDQETLAAWCNAKGRVHTLFRLRRDADGFQLYLPSSMLGITLPRLKMFVLRSQVELNAHEVERELTGVPADTRVRQGIPQIFPETREQFLPQMLNLDLMGAIDFKKGCYPGQEIVARTQYLGQLKRRMYRLLSAEPAVLPGPGSEVTSVNGAKGTVIESIAHEQGGWECLAVIPIESAATQWVLTGAEDKPLLARELSYPTS